MKFADVQRIEHLQIVKYHVLDVVDPLFSSLTPQPGCAAATTRTWAASVRWNGSQSLLLPWISAKPWR